MKFINTKNILLVAFSTVLCGIVLEHTVSAATHTLNITSSGAQTINTLTTGDGVSISTDAINITTTCRYGYNFTISTSVNDNNLYLNGDATNNTSGTYFSPVDGASTLSNSTNAWGYFYNSDSTIVPTKTSVFSPVPVLGQADTLKTVSPTAASSDINDSFNLYYGVKTSSTMASGTYKMIPDTNNSNQDGTIVYQATIADNCMRYTVSFNPTSTAGGTTLSGTGTMNNQNIYEGVATPLTANGFTAPSGYYFAGWNTAQDGTGTTYDDGQSVTDLTTVGSTITLYAQWGEPCPGGKICYKKNGANVVGTMGMQTVEDTDTSIMLLASNFSRSGYGFAGWSDVPDYATNQNAHFFGPQEDITFTAGQYSVQGINLFAVWVQSAGSLQSDTLSVCATLTQAPASGTANLSSVSALTDQRDNETYAIAKLADGNCWMIENLRLESTNSDNSTGALAQGYGTSLTYGNFSGLADPESTGFTATYTANSLYYSGAQEGTASIDIGTADSPGYRMPRYVNWNHQTSSANRPQNPTANNDYNSTTYAGMYSYGNYYTWHAAVANLAYNGTVNQSTTGTSLCPKGWHLPTGGRAHASGDTSGVNVTGDPTTFREFYNLAYVIMGSNKTAYEDVVNVGSSYYSGNTTNANGDIAGQAFRKYPNNFLLTGHFYDATLRNRGNSGRYWSSTVYSNSNARYLSVGGSDVYPGTSSYYKVSACSVRCIADKPYMQDMTHAKLAELMPNTGDEVTLYDKRDEKAYTVAKLADGNYWMTQNLDHDIKTDGSVVYDNTTTDLGWNGTSYSTASWSPSTATYDTSTTTWASSGSTSESYDPGELYWDGVTTSSSTNQTSSTGDSHYHLGNFYNWTAAIAMNDSSGHMSQDELISQSICPSGWTLPKSGTYTGSGSFQTLVTQYGWSNNKIENPNIWDTSINAALSGLWTGSLTGVGRDGSFWSSVSYRQGNSYYQEIRSTGYVNPTYDTRRGYGLSIRCVAR